MHDNASRARSASSSSHCHPRPEFLIPLHRSPRADLAPLAPRTPRSRQPAPRDAIALILFPRFRCVHPGPLRTHCLFPRAVPIAPFSARAPSNPRAARGEGQGAPHLSGARGPPRLHTTAHRSSARDSSGASGAPRRRLFTPASRAPPAGQAIHTSRPGTPKMAAAKPPLQPRHRSRACELASASPSSCLPWLVPPAA